MEYGSLVFGAAAGFNLDSIEGEKLPTFAKTLKTGAMAAFSGDPW